MRHLEARYLAYLPLQLFSSGGQESVSMRYVASSFLKCFLKSMFGVNQTPSDGLCNKKITWLEKCIPTIYHHLSFVDVLHTFSCYCINDKIFNSYFLSHNMTRYNFSILTKFLILCQIQIMSDLRGGSPFNTKKQIWLKLLRQEIKYVDCKAMMRLC